jgi:hypothetical protein
LPFGSLHCNSSDEHPSSEDAVNTGRLTSEARRADIGGMRPFATLTLAVAAAGLAQACSVSEAQERHDEPVDLTGVMELRSAAGCRFDALTNHALQGLLILDGFEPFAMSHAPEVAIGELRLRPQITREDDANYPGQVFYRSAVSLPTGSRWHGLTALELWSEYVHNPETDHYEQRGLTFAESPGRLRETLLTLGADVPLAPDFRELDDWGPYTGGCGGSIQITPVAQGAALVCNYGC